MTQYYNIAHGCKTRRFNQGEYLAKEQASVRRAKRPDNMDPEQFGFTLVDFNAWTFEFAAFEFVIRGLGRVKEWQVKLLNKADDSEREIARISYDIPLSRIAELLREAASDWLIENREDDEYDTSAQRYGLEGEV